MAIQDSLGDRMKAYEGVPAVQLMRRTPVILRIDGKAFHTFTRGLDKPYDKGLSDAMVKTMNALCRNIQGALLGYTQSDEISILVQDWATFTTDRWFDYNVQKMVSIAASIATATFNGAYTHPSKQDAVALFDARAFNVPFEDVTNYFIWRQKDAERNSINSLAQANFSHKSLQGLKVSQVHDKLMLEKGINWNDVPTRFKRGVCTRLVGTVDTFNPLDIKFSTGMVDDFEIPVFTQDREYVERMLTFHEEFVKHQQEVVEAVSAFTGVNA